MKKTKTVLLVIAFALSAIFAKSQTPTDWFSPDMLFDTTIYDNEGVRYSLDDIRIDTVSLDGSGQKTQLLTSATCANSYFNLYFDPNSGMASLTNPTEIARRNVLLELFCDISQFITNQGGVSNKVNILIGDPNVKIPSASSSGIVAGGTPYYSYPFNPAKSGIIDNEIWKTINSGQDSYIGIASPLIATGSFYHGQLVFNFANTSFTFHDDLTTNASAGTYDIYTLGLHEVMHMMGFTTGIYYNGNSKITNTGSNSSNYYTRYDQFLKTQGGVSLITSSTSATCSMYQFNFNTSLTATAVLSPSAASCSSVLPSFGYTNVTTCSTSIMYSSAAQNINVYTPNCYEFVSSLSHFEDMCYPTNTPANNDQYFVMCSGNTTAMTKRYLKEEERKVLCDIGYSVAATYGNATYPSTQKTYTAGACNGLGVVGINDGLGTGANYTYTTTVGVATGIIQPLTNDVGTSGGAYECLEIVNGSGTLQNTAGTSFTYNPSSAGLHLLRYVPKSSGGVKGNITYIYVKVVGSTSTCPTPNNCEMVYNGGFESASTTCGFSWYDPSNGPFMDCWSVISGYYNYLIRNCSTSSSINGFAPGSHTIPYGGVDSWNLSPNNAFIRLDYTASNINNNIQQGMLNTNLVPSSQYKVSFWVNPAAGSLIVPLVISLATATAPVIGPIPNSSVLPVPYTSLATFTVIPDGNWHNCSALVTFSGTVASQYIGLVSLSTPTNNAIIAYALYDDISILPASAATAFTLPAISCSGANYNLNSLVSIPNGTFTGPGVSYSSPNYFFDANTAGTGLHSIIYTYTTATGCTLTAVAQTSVVTTPTAITVFANPPAGLCASYPTATLTAGGATTYTFTDGTTSTYTNPATVSPVATTVYTITGANATCSLSTTFTVNYTTACLCVATNTVPSTLNTTTLNLSSGYSLQGAVTITGGNVAFIGADMRCSPGSSITVANGATLTITQSHLYSCFDMWEGIVVQDGGYLIINTSLIEDAVKAIDVTNNTSTTGKVLDISTTVFNKNVASISITNYTQTITNYPFAIKSSLFTSRDFTFTPTSWPTQGALTATCTPANPLGSPYCIQNFPVVNPKAPNNADAAYFGISLSNVGVTSNPTTTPTYKYIRIGDPTNPSYFNVFDNLRLSITAINSNFKAAHNVFQNTKYRFGRGYLEGVAIEAMSDDWNSNSVVLTANNSYSTTSVNKFYDCNYAVRTTDIFELDAQWMRIQSTQTASANFQEGKYGIYNTSKKYRLHEIKYNKLANIENGITFNSTYGSIAFGGSSYFDSQYAGQVYISNNTITPIPSGAITTEFVSNAITVENAIAAPAYTLLTTSPLLEVSDNVMTDVYRGIAAINNSNPALMSQNNTCTLALDPGGNLQNGISISACTNPSVQLNSILGPNTTNTITTGIYASMNTAPKVTCNTVSTTYQGFEFAGSQAGTKWKGNSMTTHTLGLVLSNTAVIGAQGSSTAAIDNAWNGTWSGIIYNTYNGPNSLATSSPLWVQNTAPYLPVNFNSFFAGQDYGSGGLNTATGAYSCAGGGARMMASNDDEQSFYDVLESIANYVPVKNNNVDPANYIAQYKLYKILEDDLTLLSKSKNLSDFYYNNKTLAYGKLLNVENQLINGNYSSALSIVNGISNKNHIENNYNEFANLYSKYYTKTYDSTDNKTLFILANKCPFIEGEVIYHARAFYNIINSTVEVFNDNCPDNSASRLNNSSALGNNWTVNLYPNPATDELFINTNNQKEDLKITITDVNGRLIADYNSKIIGFYTNIKLNMISGIYFVTLVNQNNEKVVKKLVITK